MPEERDQSEVDLRQQLETNESTIRKYYDLYFEPMMSKLEKINEDLTTTKKSEEGLSELRSQLTDLHQQVIADTQRLESLEVTERTTVRAQRLLHAQSKFVELTEELLEFTDLMNGRTSFPVTRVEGTLRSYSRSAIFYLQQVIDCRDTGSPLTASLTPELDFDSFLRNSLETLMRFKDTIVSTSFTEEEVEALHEDVDAFFELLILISSYSSL